MLSKPTDSGKPIKPQTADVKRMNALEQSKTDPSNEVCQASVRVITLIEFVTIIYKINTYFVNRLVDYLYLYRYQLKLKIIVMIILIQRQLMIIMISI